MTGRVIRPAVEAGSDVLGALMGRAIRFNNAPDYPPAVIARLIVLHDPSAVAAMIATRRVFVATDGWRAVGTVALQGPVVRGLFVDPDAQGRGWARALVEHVEAEARAEGRADLSLQSSLTAHGFYERLGWRTQAFRYHPEGSTYRMVKQPAIRFARPHRP